MTILSCTWVAVHPNIPSPKKLKANSWIEGCILNPLLSFADHRLPLLVVGLYVTCTRVRAGLGDQTILERSKISQGE